MDSASRVGQRFNCEDLNPWPLVSRESALQYEPELLIGGKTERSDGFFLMKLITR